jgi:hypothetical protein
VIGIVIAAIRVAPLVLLYPPLRLARRRGLRRLRRMLDGPVEPPGLDQQDQLPARRRVPSS